MDMLDPSLDSGEDKVDSGSEAQIELGDAGVDSMNPGTLTIDANGQYRLTTDSGQVTYRVVQVAQDDGGQTQVLANQIPSAQLMPSLNVVATDGLDNLTDSKLGVSYLPTVSGGGDASGSQALDASQVGPNASGSGPFYVMMSPQDVLQAAGTRVIAPRTGLIGTRSLDGTRTTRDDRRRQSHNEVERRRRDKINNWIVQLSKLIPNCDGEISKSGQISKGGILSKACDHIADLRQANAQMAENLKEAERYSLDNELLRQQIEELKQENSVLRSTLHQHGILPPDLNSH